MQLALLRQGDWPGIATMAIGLASLQTVLEEGNKDDWFGSPFIVRLSLVAAVALGAVPLDRADHGAAAAEPAAADGAATSGLAAWPMSSLAWRCTARSILLPSYLSQTQGYNAQQVGEVLAWTGLPQLVLIPLVPRLMQRFDAACWSRRGLAYSPRAAS